MRYKGRVANPADMITIKVEKRERQHVSRDYMFKVLPNVDRTTTVGEIVCFPQILYFARDATVELLRSMSEVWQYFDGTLEGEVT